VRRRVLRVRWTTTLYVEKAALGKQPWRGGLHSSHWGVGGSALCWCDR
jgi:hypothetical protein